MHAALRTDLGLPAVEHPGLRVGDALLGLPDQLPVAVPGEVGDLRRPRRQPVSDRPDDLVRGAGRRRGGDLPGGVRPAEPLAELCADQHRQPGRRAVDRVRHPGPRADRADSRHGSQRRLRRPNPHAGGAADRHPRRARSAPRGAAFHPTGVVRAGSDPVADGVAPAAAGCGPGHHDRGDLGTLPGAGRGGSVGGAGIGNLCRVRADDPDALRRRLQRDADADLLLDRRAEAGFSRDRRRGHRGAADGADLDERRSGADPLPV